MRGGTTVFAEENIGEFSLDTMVVTATRTAVDKIKVPSTVHVVTEEDIKQKNVLTITDALKEIPGLYDGRQVVCQTLQTAYKCVGLENLIY